MAFSLTCYDQEALICNPGLPCLRTVYATDILISGFSKETTLKDLHIRFSVYGAIRNCYWSLNSEKNREAVLIFYDAYSGLILNKDSRLNEIYLHGKQLTVHSRIEDNRELMLYLENDHGNTSIDELSDDCLFKIFKYLSIAEQMKLRRVCARWCTIANELLRTVRDMDLRVFKEDLINFENCNHDRQLQSLLNIIEKRKLMTKRFLLNCEGHSSLDVIASLRVHLLAAYRTNLTKLIIGYSTFDEDILSHILKMNQSLRHIEIYDSIHISGKSLIHLPAEMRTFILRTSYQYVAELFKHNYLYPVLKRLKNLKRLELEVLYNQSVDILDVFNESWEHLETLTFNLCIDRTKSDLFLPITNLKKLRRLTLTRCNLTDIFLMKLSENCQELSSLELSYDFQQISKRGMSAIASLTKLQQLKISCWYRTELNFANFFGLQKLEIENFYIQEEQIITIIRNSPKLKYLDVRCRQDIILKNLSEARMISVNHCNNENLYLVIRYDGSRDVPHSPDIIKRYVIYEGNIY